MDIIVLLLFFRFSDGQLNSLDYIVGGDEARPHQFPWLGRHSSETNNQTFLPLFSSTFRPQAAIILCWVHHQQKVRPHSSSLH